MAALVGRLRRRRGAGEAGLSLIEVLATIAIMSILLISMVGLMQVSLVSTDVNRRETSSQTIARNFAEYMKAVEYDPGACGAAEPYDAALSANAASLGDFGEGFEATIVLVESWDAVGADFVSPCTESGLQRLTLQITPPSRTITTEIEADVRRLARGEVTSAGELAPATLQIVKRSSS